MTWSLPVEKTELFPPDIKPVHVGFYETTFADGGWVYEVRVWFDGRQWRDSEKGWALIDQNVSWRGLTKEQEQ